MSCWHVQQRTDCSDSSTKFTRDDKFLSNNGKVAACDDLGEACAYRPNRTFLERSRGAKILLGRSLATRLSSCGIFTSPPIYNIAALDIRNSSIVGRGTARRVRSDPFPSMTGVS
jgi:hypothetical protein